MMEYTFTLKYQLSDDQYGRDELLERLGAAGCDDATVGVALPGRVALEFVREAPSAHMALVSALADVRRAVPAARLIEAVPDYVGLTDVADAVGVTRQNMRKLMIAHADTFPAPVHCGSTAIWHLADVLDWLQARGAYAFKAGLLEVAATAKQVNLARAAQQAELRVQREVSEFVA